VEIGPVEGSYPGMLKTRGYELRLPADWPPASVTVNGAAVPQGRVGKTGWTFEGNTLTTIIPVRPSSTAARVTIEVRRAAGLTARRGELDGFAGAMTRLRGAYDALQQSSPVAVPPDPLIDAMQTGDRLGYHPERAVDEITHFHDVLPKAQAAVNALDAGFEQRVDEAIKRNGDQLKRIGAYTEQFDPKAAKQQMIDNLHRAERLADEAVKSAGEMAASARP
jgi:hypothetical protein